MTNLAEILAAGLNLSPEQLSILTNNAQAWKELELRQLAEDVARAKEGTKLTRRGFDLLGKAVAGKELRFTRVALGDANGETPDDDAQFEMNTLIHECYTADITNVQHTGGGTCAVKAQVKNAHVEDGFRIVEVGLFALDPDTNEECLYCYRNSGTASSWMPSGDGSVLWDIVLTVITVIDKATNITAVIDSGLVYLTQVEFLEHVASENPHPNIPSKAEAVTIATTIWVNGGDDKLHPMAIEDLGNQMLGGDASNIPKMNARLTQTEVNLLNIYTQLNAERTLGVQGNLMMIEPFDTKRDCCDEYTCPVVTAVAGISNIQIENDKDILVGSWYTITDGTRAETVQLRSIARNGTTVVAIFNQILNETYDLTRTQLMRTSALLGTNQASGAGDIRGTTLAFTETFTGTGGNTSRTLTLETTQSNASNFTIDGDGAFSGDGYFTLSA